MGTFAGAGWITGDTIPASELNTLSGAWDTYTPSVGGTGFALGNGTISGRWKKVGRVVTFIINVTWGSTSTYGAGPLTLTLPTAAQSSGAVFGARYLDVGSVVGYPGFALSVSGSTTITPLCHVASATYATDGGLTSTIPFTWANTDTIVVSGTYESSS